MRYRSRKSDIETARLGFQLSIRGHPSVLVALILLTLLPGCARLRLPIFSQSEAANEEPGEVQPPTVVVPALTGPGVIRGRIVMPSADTDSIALSKVVVYAQKLGKNQGTKANANAETIRRQDDGFTPELAVVSVDQMVHFRDDGDLFHRIFSYSEPNAFDLGLAGDGNFKSVVFHHPGLVRFYCSLHGWESGAIYVAPSPHFDRPRPGGEYELADLPPGKYRIAAWGESLAASSVDVVVEAGQSTSLELPITRARELQ